MLETDLRQTMEIVAKQDKSQLLQRQVKELEFQLRQLRKANIDQSKEIISLNEKLQKRELANSG